MAGGRHRGGGRPGVALFDAAAAAPAVAIAGGVKIATWNINGINRRLPLLLDWLAATKPDVVCLQELKSADAELPKAAIDAAGYGAVWHGQRTWNGVAVLARDREPIELRHALPGDGDDHQSRYIEAAVAGIVVASLYLPNGNPQPGPKFDYKQAWFERLIAHAAELAASGHPVLLAGDYNVVPTDDVADIYNTRSWLKNALLQPAPRASYRRLLAGGWTDAVRALHPDQPAYTFWSVFRDSFARDAGMRIDHLLLSASLAPRLRAAGVDRDIRGRDGASDHAPVWVELAD